MIAARYHADVDLLVAAAAGAGVVADRRFPALISALLRTTHALVPAGNADGAWGSTHVLAELTLGIAASIPNQVNKTTGFYSLPFINAAPLTAGAEPSYLGYLRIRTVASGTTPSVTYEAWVAKDE